MRGELLKYMLLEDIRLHSELRGSRSFFLFPLVLAVVSAGVTYFLSMYSSIGQSTGLIPVFITLFFSFGIMSGTFGLHATDYLERRFGDYGKLFSNAMVLPVKLKDIFLMAAASDSIFYFGWFILPITGGATAGLALAGSGISHMPMLLLSLSLAFLLGIGLSFFLTVLLAKSRAMFYIATAAVFAVAVAGLTRYGALFFLPYQLYLSPGWKSFVFNVLLISIIFYMTGKLIGNEYNTIRAKKHHKSLEFRTRHHFLFKDFIDLRRTHGLVAKPLFNVAIPSILMILLFSSIDMFKGELFGVTNNLVFISILLGTFSISFFNVLLSGDSYDYYRFLPVSLKDFILSKIILSQAICSLLGIILLFMYAAMNSTYLNMVSGILLLMSFIFYNMCINLFINGLKPNDNSLNITSLGWMAVLLLPVIIAGMVLPFFYSSIFVFLLFAALLCLAGFVFFRISIGKWTRALSV